MSKQVIAVDLDDVLAASAAEYVAYGNRRWGTNLSVEDYHEDWAIMWQVDRETESQRAREIYKSKIVRNFPADKAAHEALQQLKKHYDLVIATSRVTAIHTETLEWLNKHFPGIFTEVHFSGIYDHIAHGALPDEGMHALTKGELIREIGADYLIDDQPKHCLAAAEAGIETILFGDYAWNRDVGTLLPRVTRCLDWVAVGEFFDARR